ncbi:hypothetical protein CONLIGDRAFT_690397 [Coniochaeta ligniaria NRRL 30616]|uniref:Oxidase ustYa n=1 Tax=Coniochaeta ligniaria NRRL 30616 TaxID=1408157 RepID=A0A1J7J7C5_9PEZI|nr:hypothetical protein CONLIGDRAFT_690397 [Coniochaeta ligniaria NRRL 30616]
MEPSNPVYENVPVTDEHYESRSCTEVDESLIGDEHHWHSISPGSTKRQRRNACISIVQSYRGLIDTFLLLVIMTLLLILLLRNERKGAESGLGQVGGDYTGVGPIFKTNVVKWEANMSFVPSNPTEFFSNETLATWNTVMPTGTGRGLTTDSFSTTSMTHQLHCLFMMGRIYSGMLTNSTGSLPTDWHSHFLHCIDYLRQAIMCSADLALEIHGPNDADDLGPLDGGWNGHHVCKDYSQVIGYLESQITAGERTVLPIDD